MRRALVLPLLCVLLSATLSAPPASACVIWSGGWETTEYSVTVNAGDRQITVGAYVTQEQHYGSESVCIFVAPVFTVASTQVTPIVVIS